MNDSFGNVTEAGIVRFERVLPGPIERVWAYLTESEKRGTWLASGPMELYTGGRVELHFHHETLTPHDDDQPPDHYKKMEDGHTNTGRVLRCEPPYLLSYTWGENSNDVSEVTFELATIENGVLLVLIHRRLDSDTTTVSVASGWHTHLGILTDRLSNRIPEPFWSTHAQMESRYKQLLTAET